MPNKNRSRRRRRPVRSSNIQRFTDNMRVKIPAASSLSIPRSTVELQKDRALTLTRIRVELTGTIGSQANAGALIAQIRVFGVEQTVGFKWTTGPFMVSSGTFTTRVWNIPSKFRYVIPRNVPDNFIMLSIDHICADKTLDNTIIHGLLHLTFLMSQEQVAESCPAAFTYRRDGSPIPATIDVSTPFSSLSLS